MPQAFEWMVAFRYLRARRQDSFISIIAIIAFLGISLGVATLIIVMAVMNGFRAELLDKILGYNGHIVVNGYSGEIRAYEDLTARIRAIPGVKSATPFIQGQVMAINRGLASGAIVRGVAAEDLTEENLVNATVVTGSLDDLDSEYSVILGHRLARSLGLMAGDEVTLLSPKFTSTPLGSLPRGVAFTIAATVDMGVFDYDSSFIGMPLDMAQRYFRLPDAVSSIEIFLENPEDVDRIMQPVIDIIGDQGVATGWRQFNAALVGALDVERNVMFIILTLIILVASLNIISSLIMLVKDKSRDIAILRTMGASQVSVLRIFIIAGASIGIVGTLGGFLLGVAFVENIETIRQFLQALTGTELWNPEVRFLSEIPAKMDMGEVIATLGIALLLSLLATLPPSWRASRLDPVEVLRYE